MQEEWNNNWLLGAKWDNCFRTGYFGVIAPLLRVEFIRKTLEEKSRASSQKYYLTKKRKGNVRGVWLMVNEELYYAHSVSLSSFLIKAKSIREISSNDVRYWE